MVSMPVAVVSTYCALASDGPWSVCSLVISSSSCERSVLAHVRPYRSGRPDLSDRCQQDACHVRQWNESFARSDFMSACGHAENTAGFLILCKGAAAGFRNCRKPVSAVLPHPRQNGRTQPWRGTGGQALEKNIHGRA